MDFKKLTGIFLAFLVLFSNTGIAVSVHYCGGKMASVQSGFGVKAGCGMVTEQKKSCEPAITSPTKKCCDNRTFTFKAKQSDSSVKVYAFTAAFSTSR